jgi:DNA polymerase I-like protein with 3'-5' exonuclease and polymerase domains
VTTNFGDEDGVFWLPGPSAVSTRGGKRGPREVREFVPIGPPPESDWAPVAEFPRLTGLVGLDFETCDPGIKKYGPRWPHKNTGKVVGFSLAADKWSRYYPFEHEGGGNLDKESCLRYLRDVAASTDVQFVAHNAMYEMGWCKRYGIKMARVPYDTQGAVALLDEYRQRSKRGYNLNAVAWDYCGIRKTDEKLAAAAAYFGYHSKNDLWRLHSKYVGEYGEGDAELARDVWLVLKPLLDLENLWPLAWLEFRYAAIAVEMRWNGIRVDEERAHRFVKYLDGRMDEARLAIRKMVGFDVPVWEGDTIAKAFDVLKLKYPRTAQGAPSFVKAWLNGHQHPIGKLIGDVRRWDKASGTFVKGFFIDLAVDGRVHPQVNPLPTDEAGTVSGRISVERPNVNQLSAKDKEMAREVRGLLLPEEGAEWASLDISQQEPRIAVHFAYLAGVRGSKQVVELYRKDPKIDFHLLVSNLCKQYGSQIERDPAKILNLALIYGKGEAATCRSLGFDTEIVKTRWGPREVAGPEGKAFIASYHRVIPFVSGLKEACLLAVRQKGYIRTLLHRRCRFGEGKSPSHTAVNRLVQGSAADQMKKAQVDMYEAYGEVPMCQVYDEVDINKYSDEQVDRVVECIKQATPLEVPIVVDVAVGKNWGEAL